MKASLHTPYRPERADPPTIPVFPVFLGLLLLALSLWATVRLPAPAPSDPLPVPGPRLELALSGALTGQLSLSADDFTLLRCTPSGFHLRSTPTLSPAALELRFRAPAAPAGRNATYLLSAGVGPLTLKTAVNGAAGPTFSSLGGSVTATPSLRSFRFAASMADAQHQPLLISGRLVCP